MKCFWTFFKEDNGVDVFDTFICKFSFLHSFYSFILP